MNGLRLPGLLACLVMTTIPLVAQPSAEGHAHGTPPAPEVLAAFDQVEADVASLSPATLGRGRRASLLATLAVAEASYRRGHPCVAAAVLGAYLHETQAFRRGRDRWLAESLYTQGRQLRADLLDHLPAGRSCPGHARSGASPAVEIRTSDNTRLAGRITFGEPRMWSVEAGGEVYTEVALPGAGPGGLPGQPGVPFVHRLVAVPRGADVSLQVTRTDVAETLRVNLYPVQPSPADAEPPFDSFGDLPFVRDAAAYLSNREFPEAVCTVRPLGRARDLAMALVSCAAGRYNPVTDVLTLFRSVDVEVRFTGGSGFFLPQASLGPFETQTPLWTGAVLNRAEVPRHVDPARAEPVCDGEELLILAPPAMVAEAERLAGWKRSRGIVTNVVPVGATTTAEDIRAFIFQRFDGCRVRPSHVLLFGDAEHVSTFYGPTVFSTQTGSDFRYAVHPAAFLNFLPSLAVGRLPVDSDQEAATVVDKIIGYEGTPPAEAAFYANATVARAFQCCRTDTPYPGVDQRWYIETVERVRDVLVGQGHAVERIYAIEPNGNYTKPLIPRRYRDGRDLPVDLRESSGFAWDGSTQDLVDAFNARRFLVLHRDHGSWERWKQPLLTRDDVATRLANGNRLPVVFSLNCSTGLFDNETNPGEWHIIGGTVIDPYPSPNPDPTRGTGPGSVGESYFSERLLRLATGGAVAVIGATRDSPSWANDALTLGLFDAVWPDTLPDHGPATPIHRLGDMLNHAKLYAFQAMGVPGAEADVSPLQDGLSEFYLWHVLGDPTLALWTAPPPPMAAHHGGLEVLADALRVHYAEEGATITAFQVLANPDSLATVAVPVGRGRVTEGVATIEYVVPPVEDVPILLSASKDGAVGRLLMPPGGGDVDPEW